MKNSVKIANEVLNNPEWDDVLVCLEWATEKLRKLGVDNEYTLGMWRSLTHAEEVAKYARENLVS